MVGQRVRQRALSVGIGFSSAFLFSFFFYLFIYLFFFNFLFKLISSAFQVSSIYTKFLEKKKYLHQILGGKFFIYFFITFLDNFGALNSPVTSLQKKNKNSPVTTIC
jgi:hypothetical protein